MALPHPDLTPNKAAEKIAGSVGAYQRVRTAVEAKMRSAGQDVASIQRCLARLEELKDAWIAIADRQTRSGGDFAYANEEAVRRLLQVPFDQQPNMEPERAWFLAARSMRDTEPVSLLRLRGPDGSAFA